MGACSTTMTMITTTTPIRTTTTATAMLVLSLVLLVQIPVLSLSFAPAALHRSLSFAVPVHQNPQLFRTGSSIAMEADSNDVDSSTSPAVTKPAAGNKKSKKKK